MSDAEPLFTKRETIDQPGIIGARWWQESIATEVPRRKAVQALMLGGALGALGLVGWLAHRSSYKMPSLPSLDGSPPDYQFSAKAALDMQKEYGWNFGATDVPLVFDGTTTVPFDRQALDTLMTDLSPGNPAWLPYFVPTLFQSPGAMPKSKPAGDPDASPFHPLKESIVPVTTPAMTTAFEQGKALAAILHSQPARMKDLAIVVDLPGPLAVSFAAGMVGVFDPIFLFDNWPHPHGVVPAHLTLAAALYYQPLFAKARSADAKARPLFVLDRNRLSTYVDNQELFDNRHTAKMPTTAKLRDAGVKNILYVGPNAVDREELDDLNDDFVAYAAMPVTFRLCPATAFERQGTDLTTALSGDAGTSDLWLYGGTKTEQAKFWTLWDKPADDVYMPNALETWIPRSRSTPYSAGHPASTSGAQPRPEGFGTVPVAVAVATGVVLGARASRSGSWNRTPYSSTSS